MDDQMLMENLLNMSKSMVSLYEHASVEASSDKIHNEFTSLLEDTLSFQHRLYTNMSDKGWYPSEQAQAKQITKTIDKYANQ